MKVLDNLRERFARRQETITVKMLPGGVPPEDKRSLAKRILDSPADFNRATRRSVGLFGRLWKWDVNGTEMQRTYVPRYVRKHYDRVMLSIESGPPTGQKRWPRSVRKQRARIARVISSKGMA